MSRNSHDTLSRYLLDLSDRGEGVRSKAAKNLRIYLEAEAREMSRGTFSDFMTETTRRIYDLVSSAETHERIGGIMAIDELIEVPCEDNETKIIRFANYLRMVFQQPVVETPTLTYASRALGHLARAGGTVTADFVEFELKRSMDWLQGDPRGEAKRYAAVLVLKELAVNSPVLFSPLIPTFFDHIWAAIHSDGRPVVREAAVEALRAALAIIAKRGDESWHHHQLFSKVSEQISEGFRAAAPASIHGSLLVLVEGLAEGRVRSAGEKSQRLASTASLSQALRAKLIDIAGAQAAKQVIGELLRNTGDFMRSRCEETCKTVFAYRSHRHLLVQKAAIQLLPQLALFYPDHFTQQWLEPCMAHLVSVLKAAGDHYGVAFAAVGEISLAVGQAIMPYTPQIIELVNMALPSQAKWRKQGADNTNEALRCVSKLAKAVGPSLAPQIETLVDQMFEAGLSQPLLDVLGDLARSTPSLLPAVQTKLLSCIASVLTVPQRADAAPGDEAAEALALAALGCFGAGDPRARDVVSTAVVQYFDHPTAAIRREAALTVTRLLLPSREHAAAGAPGGAPQWAGAEHGGGLGHDGAPAAQRASRAHGFSQRVVLCRTHQLTAVAGLLRHTLMFAASEPDKVTRERVFESFDSRYDPFLCEPGCVSLLAQALHDEALPVRQAVARIMGRLERHNPSHVVPALRRLLLRLMTELAHAAEPRLEEEAVLMICTLSLHARRLIEPYVGAVAGCLLKRLREAQSEGSPKLVARLLEAIGELSEVSGQEVKPFLPDLVPLLVDAIQDHGGGTNVLKREQLEQAYRALRLVVENTGHVVELYEKHPSFLPFLIDSLRSDVHMGDWQQRQQILRCIGTLGALDPASFRRLASCTKSDPVSGGDGGPALALLEGEAKAQTWPWLSSGYRYGDPEPGCEERPDIFAAHALAALLRLLGDASLAAQHGQVAQALMKIFKSLGPGCVPFLPQIMAAFLQVIRTLDAAESEALLPHLAELVRLAGPRLGGYLQAIFEVVASIWRGPAAARGSAESAGTTVSLLALLEETSRCHRDALRVHLGGGLLATILGHLHQGRDGSQAVALQVLRSLVAFGHALGDHLHLVIPALVRRFEEDSEGDRGDPVVRECAIRALGELSAVVQFPHLLGQVVHPLLRILDSPSPQSLKDASVDSLSLLRGAFDEAFAVFAPQVRRVLARQDPPAALGDEEHLARARAAWPRALGRGEAVADDAASSFEAPHSSFDVAQPNQHSLRLAWEASHPKTKDDWAEWMRRLALELLRESPSAALRACFPLAQVYYPLQRELLHVSFLACWLHLQDAYPDLLARSLETALHSPNLPPDILQALLNLAEFMDRSGLPLPIDARTLGGLSEKCHAYAKALHYKETEFATSEVACVEALISINTQLQQTEAAQGILAYAQKNLNVELREPWYERLQRWEDALEAYEMRQLEDPASLEWTKSRMRCLHALGEWNRLSQLSRAVWEREGNQADAVRQEAAPMAAAAECHLRDWERMEVYVDVLEGSRNSSYEGCFHSAILAIHQENYQRASRLISRARETLDPELTALVGESYTRAYRSLVKVQQLTELEEVIKYKTTDREQTRQSMREMWAKRLDGCQPSVDVWQAALQIRSIVIPPCEDLDTWLRFGALCRRSSRLDLAVKALEPLRGNPAVARDPRVTVAHVKNCHAAGGKRRALDMMKEFLRTCGPGGASDQLISRCRLKMGLWTREVYEEERKCAYVEDERTRQEVLRWLESAVELSGDYKAWNAWALANFQVVEAMEAEELQRAAASTGGGAGRPAPEGGGRPGGCGARTTHAAHAVRGFVKSAVLARKTALQDILRLLTLWFKYAGDPEVEPTLREGIDSTPLDAWLLVVPQILARLRSPKRRLRATIHSLLGRVARAYPQAVVFPLTVAAKSTTDTVANSARSLLQGIRSEGGEKLVEQSEMVSAELIRISILWHEVWCQALEEASRLYHVESNPEAMVKVLQPLHEQMKVRPQTTKNGQGPQTMREIAFQQAFSRELHEAWKCIQRYQELPPGTPAAVAKAETDKAWQSYYRVFQKIRKQVQALSHLDMQSVSPKLLHARGLDLAVPGTYAPERGGDVITIESFSPSIEVVTSKQRPRILQVIGSDGRSYQFLLKGHEDLKQDERVMQLFGLINSLLEGSVESAKHDLSIARFAVVPLSADSGLIEWVPRCDTLHQLIKMYRNSRHVELSVEYQLMRSMCARCEDLNILQKVEVFRHAMHSTLGADLQRVLWLQSRNSEVWLSRRTTYCRSLAVMSVVGYILGLGDRHPSNLMIARESGQVVHIDFGDCFEVAAFREKYPEKIPFRLTRMLLNALEVSGVEGNYRYTCELVMRLLRGNKDAVMAMLEAFVFDPLITWRLLPPGHAGRVQVGGPPGAGQPISAHWYVSPLQTHDETSSRSTSIPSPTAPPGGPRPPPAAVAAARQAAPGGAAVTAGPPQARAAPGGGGQEPAGRPPEPARPEPAARPAAEPAGAEAAAPGGPPAAGGEAAPPVGPGSIHHHFVLDAPDGAERDPHLASVRGRQARQRELEELGPEGALADPEKVSSAARSVISRVYSKLNGTDFRTEVLDVEAQVERLLQEATSHENLSQCYVGWCPFW